MSATGGYSLVAMTSFGLLTLCLLLQSPTVAQGQNVRAPAPHRFFDAPNIILTAGESGALLADGYTTLKYRGYPGFREADPLARPFVNAGWPGQIAGGVLVVSADVGLRYWMHKRGHHKAERLLPIVLTTYGLVGAIHNARENARFRREFLGERS
jgi:hypothetical protein